MEAKPYKLPTPFKKLNKDLIDKLVSDIGEGSTHRYAAESNGITETIFNMWRKQGKLDLEYEKEDSLPAYLVVSLAKIKQKEITWCRESIKFSPKGHLGAQWTLEHAYWREYGRCEQIKSMADQIDEDSMDALGDNNGNA